MLHVIQCVEPAEGHLLHLTFSDGRKGVVDLSDLIATGGVFAALEDGDTFASVRVAESGRWIEWPNGVDLCADALYERACNGMERPVAR
jgi:hypothetical protein